ncbi:hypothetical protein C3Y98_09640 [Methylotenera oryzisoli]|jgi:phosphate-selective porin OprO/OprP|uniref:Porin n=1 Tax=Methylotenera oryzisoli TaxID=2080758 RepID=A0A4Y9VP68_9PROT|nr:porin [Methylotenera oryzisoli]TFW70573.1 hypothetical protein C3Y98_09640 [Methylotenera oryzisoli]
MNYKLRSLVAASITGALMLGVAQQASADSTIDIVNALVAKGVLTEEEGALLTKGRSGERDAAEAKSKKQINVVNKDGLRFENEDKSVSVALGGRIHADYRNFDHSGNDKLASNSSANESDTFDIRRARLVLSGQIMDHYTFQLSGDFAGQTAGNTGATLDQAWVNVNYWRPLQVTVGQFKAPISMERKMSSNTLDFLERSLHDSLGSYEDRGLMVWGIPKDGLTYAVSVINGEGNKNSNDVDSRVSKPEVQLNATVNFAELMGNKDAVYHLGVGYADTEFSKANSASSSASTWWVAGSNQFRTEARGVNFLALPNVGSVANTSNAIERQRFALEGAVALGPVKVVSEWMRNSFKGDLSPTADFNNNIDAWYVSTLWNITGEKFADFYKDGVFKGVKPTNNFDLGKGGGTWQLGLRYAHIDASDFNNSNFAAAGGGTQNGVSRINTTSKTNTFEAGAWTVGLNFVPNPNTRFMLNFVQTNFDTPIMIESKLKDNEKAITARAQFNF